MRCCIKRHLHLQIWTWRHCNKKSYIQHFSPWPCWTFLPSYLVEALRALALMGFCCCLTYPNFCYWQQGSMASSLVDRPHQTWRNGNPMGWWRGRSRRCLPRFRQSIWLSKSSSSFNQVNMLRDRPLCYKLDRFLSPTTLLPSKCQRIPIASGWGCKWNPSRFSIRPYPLCNLRQRLVR